MGLHGGAAMCVQSVQTQHAAQRGASAKGADGGTVKAYLHSEWTVCEEVFSPGAGDGEGFQV